MYRDVVDLIGFYETSLGQVARRMIRRHIRELWPDTRGLVVCGVGYPLPYLRPFREEAERAIAIIPAAAGCHVWPREGPNLVALGDETELPLPDSSVDRLLMVHGLEFTEQLRPMMREVWRILANHGRLLVVVPNRRGIWAQVESTPFGHGVPYSPSQIKHMLRETLFQTERTVQALFVPPMRSRMMLGAANAWENIGQRWLPHFAGVCIVEASKQFYAATPIRSSPVRRRARAYALAPAVRNVAARGAADAPSAMTGAETDAVSGDRNLLIDQAAARQETSALAPALGTTDQYQRPR